MDSLWGLGFRQNFLVQIQPIVFSQPFDAGILKRFELLQVTRVVEKSVKKILEIIKESQILSLQFQNLCASFKCDSKKINLPVFSDDILKNY